MASPKQSSARRLLLESLEARRLFAGLGGASSSSKLWSGPTSALFGPVAQSSAGNQPPSAVVLSNRVNSLAENSNTATAIRVADIAVVDDGVGTNVLSLTGADAASFSIVGNQLFLKSGIALDFETKPSFTVRVEVDDATVGTTPDAFIDFLLTITDINESPTITLGPNVVVNEDSGPQNFVSWASGISGGPGAESGQQLTLTVNSITPPITAQKTQWSGYAGGPQHQAISSVASQPLEAIRWQTPVDLNPKYTNTSLLIHYGSPLITQANTIIVPVKVGLDDGFKLEARNGADGSLIWTQSTDYTLPSHNWVPSYGPTLAAGNRIYYAGAGGTVYWRDAVDSPIPTTTGQIAFYGIANYNANPAAYQTIQISTPLTADAAGNIYFGFRTSGVNPLGITDGFARIAADGSATYTSASAASAGLFSHAVTNAAPAVSLDGQSIYVVVSTGVGFGQGQLLKLNSSTLAPQSSVALKDVVSGLNAFLPDDGTSSPMVGPDGDVYFGVLENPFPSNTDRGWLLHFSADLSQTKVPGDFGWDITPSVVPASMVPSYQGSSSYLLMTKYNNYKELGGDGVNKLAILDPNATMVDAGSGALLMKELLTIAGVTPDPTLPAVREWCINTAVVDPFTKSVLANSEDGKLYRWDLTTNQFSQVITLTVGIGEAYTPTMLGADGTVYAINNATLFAVGYSPANLNSGLFSVPPSIDLVTGNLTFTPAPNAFGTAKITVTLKDNGGTAGGGVDSITRSFTVTVNPVAELSKPVQIGDGTAQRSLIRQLVINFDSNVVVDADAFIVQQRTRVGGNVVLTNVTTQAVATPLLTGGTAVTLTFSGALTNGFGALVDGNYQLTIVGSKVRHASDNLAFDGNQDGIPGGDYLLGTQATDGFFALFGDSDGNGEVGTADVLRAQRAFGKHPGEAGYNAAYDYDGNLEIGTADLLRVRRAFSKVRDLF